MREISVDWSRVKGPRIRSAQACVGSGHAALGLRADYQQHLALVRKECGFTYLRFHGLLHDDMGVYREDRAGNPLYNWQYVDALFDYILDIGMKPFVELGFMPKALASGDKTIFFWRGNVTPPKSYPRWGELIRALAEHFTERYGVDEVKTWYFEVWNEPNHPSFWAGDMAQYFQLYEASVAAVKSVCPDYRVGGPATAGNQWIPELIDFCQSKKLPLDFVSTHTYAVRGSLDEFGTHKHYLSTDRSAIVDAVTRVSEQVRGSSMPDLEIHYTEWSLSYSHRDPCHDSYIAAPFILSKLKRVEGLVNSMSYWTFSDVFEEGGPGPDHFHGGFGLLNLQGIKKPAYLAYQYMNALGDTDLECGDPDAFACRSEGQVQVLFWDYTPLEQDTPNQVFYRRDLPSRPAEASRLVISGLEPGGYEVKAHRIGYRSNDVLTAYLEMKRGSSLSRAQVEELKKVGSGAPETVDTVVVGPDGVFSTDYAMRQNDVVFVTLTRL